MIYAAMNFKNNDFFNVSAPFGSLPSHASNDLPGRVLNREDPPSVNFQTNFRETLIKISISLNITFRTVPGGFPGGLFVTKYTSCTSGDSRIVSEGSQSDICLFV